LHDERTLFRIEVFEDGMTATKTEITVEPYIMVIAYIFNGSLHSQRARRNARSVWGTTIRPSTVLGASTAIRIRSLAIKKVFTIFANTTELAVRWNKCTLKIAIAVFSKFLAPRAKVDGRTTRVRTCDLVNSRDKKFPRSKGRVWNADRLRLHWFLDIRQWSTTHGALWFPFETVSIFVLKVGRFQQIR
jgi:hypothetical protein